MKKLFFTAIAMIAFSSASMANTIADENTKSENDDSKEILIRKKDDPCLGAYQNTYNANIDQYGSTVAGQIASAGWEACRSALCPDDNCN